MSVRKAFLWVLAIFAAIFLSMGVFAAVALHFLGGAFGPPSGERVGVVEVKGFIADSSHAVEGLKKFGKDPEVKAVVVRVASPGGVVAPSQEIHDAVKKLAAEKPVIASFGPVAASGGYYLSAPATRIVASPGSITGSIGVILQFSQYSVLMDKLGLRFDAVKSGEFKDAGSPFREMKPEERKLMQGVVDDIFAQFVGAVAEGRKLDRAKVLELADGRIYSGRQALELGLVDQLGGYEEALALAAELGGIRGEVKTEKWERKRGGLLGALLGADADTAVSVVDPLTAPPIRFVLPNW